MIRSGYHELTTKVCEIKVGNSETINGAAIDTLGYGGVKFVIVIGNGEAGAFLAKVQQDTVVGMGTAADLEGTALAFNNDAGAYTVAIIDVKQPQERFVRCVLVVPVFIMGVNVTITAELYNPRAIPVAAPVIGEYHVSPAEGVA
jgi:hypothetical protein